MNEKHSLENWSIWYPKAAATGLLVGRSMIDPTEKVILHAAPKTITVEVEDETGRRLAYGKDLEMTDITPMCLLRREGDQVIRQDIWPTEDDIGTVVLLPGGEAGILRAWWNAEDEKEWRWQVEFYNTLR